MKNQHRHSSPRGFLLHTEIEIAASPETVWQVLTEVSAYPEWNPFIRSLTGNLSGGEKLSVFLQPEGGSGMRFKPTVLSCIKNRELTWLGRLWVKGLFDGEHRFEIEDRGNGTVLFRQSERFTGLLVSLLKKSLQTGTKNGFEAMNRKLKERAESFSARSSR